MRSSGGEDVHDLETRGVEKRTMSDHGPEMSTVPLETQSLKILSKMKQPRRILVIDMYNGYGASTVLKGCEYATLASLEIDSFLTHSRRCTPPKRYTPPKRLTWCPVT